MKTKSWKLPLIIMAIIVAIIGTFTFGFWGSTEQSNFL